MTERTHVLFLDANILLKRQPTIQVRDAIHAATMLHAGLPHILSTDRHFDAIKGIRRVDPIKFPRAVSVSHR